VYENLIHRQWLPGSLAAVTVRAVRVLITGASGFAGSWLARACVADGDEVIGVSRSGNAPLGARGIALDIGDVDALTIILTDTKPDVIYHLAALSHVGRSWQNPGATLHTNATGAVSVLEAISAAARDARVVWVSSGEVYGSPAGLPISEDAALQPENPYAVSKAAGDLLAGVYAQARGLDLVRARAFAHAGPGQQPIFLISNLAKQGATAKVASAKHLEIRTGRAETRREVTDVRDVVRAYRLLADPGVPAGIYNVCSGVSSSTADRVAAVGVAISPIEVEHVVDPTLVRAHEVRDLRGSCARLHAATGWEPVVALEQTLGDTIAWWVQELERCSRAAG
jgi:GDP-4-dehydro-6-deoxy-D-mannose reductase